MADAQQPDDPCQMCDGTRLMESGEPCFECQPEPVKPGNMPPWYAIMRLTTGGWAPHFKSQDPELGMVVHVDVAEKDDAVRLCWEHRNRIRAEARAEGARRAKEIIVANLRGFAGDDGDIVSRAQQLACKYVERLHVEVESWGPSLTETSNPDD